MGSDLADSVDGVPGRFMPDGLHGRAGEAGELLPYRWAATFAARRRVLDAGCGTGEGAALLAASTASAVTGIDVDEDVVTAAAAASAAVHFDVGDPAATPYADDAFDLITSFGLIERAEDPGALLAELARVLAADGLLLASWPSRDLSRLREHWPHVRVAGQHRCLAFAILDGDESTAGAALEQLDDPAPAPPTRRFAIAGTGTLPEPRSVVGLAGGGELDAWRERFGAQQDLLHDLSSRLEEATRADGDRRAALERLAEAEEAIAQLPALRADRSSLVADLSDLQEQLDRVEQQRRDLEQRLERADATVRDVLTSPSWRVTAPLRAAKRRIAKD